MRKLLAVALLATLSGCASAIPFQKNPAVEVARIFVEGQKVQATADTERTKALVEAIVAAVGARQPVAEPGPPVKPVVMAGPTDSGRVLQIAPPILRLDPCAGAHPATFSQACVERKAAFHRDPCAYPAAWSRECSDKAYREGRR